MHILIKEAGVGMTAELYDSATTAALLARVARRASEREARLRRRSPCCAAWYSRSPGLKMVKPMAAVWPNGCGRARPRPFDGANAGEQRTLSLHSSVTVDQ